MDLIQQSRGKNFGRCDDAAFGRCVDLRRGRVEETCYQKRRGRCYTLTFLRTSLFIIEISLPKFSPRSLDWYLAEWVN